jgi:U-box domain
MSNSDIPTHYICPISHEIFLKPVVASDGHVYESAMIEKWLKANDNSPLINAKLSNKTLHPVIVLENLVNNFLRANPQFECQRFMSNIDSILRTDRYDQLLRHNNFQLTEYYKNFFGKTPIDIQRHVIDSCDKQFKSDYGWYWIH